MLGCVGVWEYEAFAQGAASVCALCGGPLLYTRCMKCVQAIEGRDALSWKKGFETNDTIPLPTIVAERFFQYVHRKLRPPSPRLVTRNIAAARGVRPVRVCVRV